MQPKRSKQIDRALTLLDRIIALIETDQIDLADSERPEPLLSPAARDRVTYQSRYWKDEEVRDAILSLFGRGSARDAAAILQAQFGPERAPKRSTLGRIYARIAQERLRTK